MKKNTKWIIIAVVVVIVAVAAYVYMKKRKESQAMQPEGIPRKPGPTNTPPTGGPNVPKGTTGTPGKAGVAAAGKPSFPLKMGSKGPAVARLQKGLGIADDGIWGSGTENAVYNYMMKIMPNSTKKPVALSSIIYAGLIKRLEMK